MKQYELLNVDNIRLIDNQNEVILGLDERLK